MKSEDMATQADETEVPWWWTDVGDDEARAVNPCLAESPQVNCPGRFENAERFAAAGLRLPGGPDQPLENLERTAKALHEILGTLNR